MKTLRGFIAGVGIAFCCAVLAQTGIPSVVQRLTVRGTLTLPAGSTLSSDNTDARFDSLGIGVAAPGGTGDASFADDVTITGTTGIGGSAAHATTAITAENATGLLVSLNESDGNNATQIALLDAGTQRGMFGVANDTAGCMVSTVQGDLCLVATSGRIMASADNGATSADLTPSSGEFTASFDLGCSTTPTMDVDYYKVGNSVTFRFQAMSGFPCTGDTTDFATSGAPVPSALRPTATTVGGMNAASCINNAVTIDCSVSVTSSGNIIMISSADSAGAGFWTGAGSRDAGLGISMSYMIGNP